MEEEGKWGNRNGEWRGSRWWKARDGIKNSEGMEQMEGRKKVKEVGEQEECRNVRQRVEKNRRRKEKRRKRSEVQASKLTKQL